MRTPTPRRPRMIAAAAGAMIVAAAVTLTLVVAVVPSAAETTVEPIAALRTLAIAPPSDAALAAAQATRLQRMADAVDAQQLQDYAASVDAAAAADQAAADAQSAVRAAQVGAPDDGYWDRMAYCETGGNWHMSGSAYSGGVGFANSTWSAYGGREFAGNAGSATREQQIIVANRVATQGYGGIPAVGYSAWGCTARVGRP